MRTFERKSGNLLLEFLPRRSNLPEGLLLAADSALYKAKQNGRNRVDATVLFAGRNH